MDGGQVAQILEEVAAMLELGGENPFKVRAYRNAAEAISNLTEDFAEALATGRLREIDGIGDTIFGNVRELVWTGRFPLHEELRARFPPGLRDCLRLPGLGARKVRLLRDLLGIDSIDSLERACLEGRTSAIKGFGGKTVEKILRGIAALRMGAGSHLFSGALTRASDLASAISATGLVLRVEIAGSLRRRREIVRDIDLVASAPDLEALYSVLPSLPGVVQVDHREQGVRARLAQGITADLIAVSDEEFGAALLFETGSQAHVGQLQARASSKGLTLEQRGLRRSDSGERVAARSEEDIYAALRLPWIPPELREGTGEIETAARGELPRLVEAEDLRGLIHVHTTESDGRDSLEAMIGAVREAGYGYVAITDHSESAVYAHGLTKQRVLAQRARIRALRRRHPDFRVFHGTEADILADGSIDFGDEFLEGFDLVVASVHSRFGLSREDQTRRLLRAVGNPLVSILGHPSGRLLLSREPLSADWEAILTAAAASGCALEINCNPERLDLDWRLCRSAVEAGIPLSIDPDAHGVAEIGRVPYGVGIARKGWVDAQATLNARSADELSQWLERRRGRLLSG